jgi:hypothetical protein
VLLTRARGLAVGHARCVRSPPASWCSLTVFQDHRTATEPAHPTNLTLGELETTQLHNTAWNRRLRAKVRFLTKMEQEQYRARLEQFLKRRRRVVEEKTIVSEQTTTPARAALQWAATTIISEQTTTPATTPARAAVQWGATIQEENSLEGAEPLEWIGRPSLMEWIKVDDEGKRKVRWRETTLWAFTTDISYNRGSTVQFKIASEDEYSLSIFRLGYYGGRGARHIATFNSLPPALQPNWRVWGDCSNWHVVLNWTIPTNARSGVFLTKLQYLRWGGGHSFALFIVRSDDHAGDVLFQVRSVWLLLLPLT